MTFTRRQFIRQSGLVTSAILFGPPFSKEMLGLLPQGDDSPQIHYDDDGHGLIVHKRGPDGPLDGGDTAQREGWYWFGVWMRQQLNNPWNIHRDLIFPDVLGRLEPKNDGVFYRHPTLPPWNNPYSKEYGFSRDQMIPLVAAMGVSGCQDCGERLRGLWNALPQDPLGGTKHTFNGEWKVVTLFGKKYKTFYTGDIVGPATIDLFRRAWNEDPMAARDNNGTGGQLELATNVKLRVAAAKDMDNTGDDLNLIVMLLMSLLRFPVTRNAKCPTTADLINWYKARPLSYGSYLGSYRQKYGVDLKASVEETRSRMNKGIKSGWQPDANVKAVYGAVRWYHREETGANPKLAELYAPIIHRYLE